MTIVRARGISVSYGPTRVLDGVDLDLRAGEVLALVGPNGTGKSTLLAVVAGDLEPGGGTVTVHGRPVREWRLQALARERSVLTQEQRLLPEAVSCQQQPRARRVPQREREHAVQRPDGLRPGIVRAARNAAHARKILTAPPG